MHIYTQSTPVLCDTVPGVRELLKSSAQPQQSSGQGSASCWSDCSEVLGNAARDGCGGLLADIVCTCTVYSALKNWDC